MGGAGAGGVWEGGRGAVGAVGVKCIMGRVGVGRGAGGYGRGRTCGGGGGRDDGGRWMMLGGFVLSDTLL